MTKRITVWLISCLVVILCSTLWSATLRLRNGKTFTGDIITKTDNLVVLKTAAGVVTQQWRACSPTSIKALHPALYQRLVKEAQERKQKQEDEMAAKGMVKVNGKWISKSELLKQQLAKIRLFVETSESKEPFKEYGKGVATRVYERECKGVLVVKCEGFSSTSCHTLKTVFTHYAYNSFGSEYKTDTKVSKTETISNVHEFQARYETSSYKQYKEKLRTGWHYNGKRLGVEGTESSGWNISIWLDDMLVYELKKDGKPVYYHVDKW